MKLQRPLDHRHLSSMPRVVNTGPTPRHLGHRPVVAADPSPTRLAHPSRTLYTFLQMPQNTFLAVIILGATVPLYQHYASLQLPWPGWTMTALDDQRLAAGIMWVGGDLLFIAAVGAVVWGWMRAEEANTARALCRWRL